MNNFYYLNGDICHPGIVEIPAGMTIREIIDTLGGGMAGGKACKAVQFGGASGGLLTADYLDLPLNFKALKGFGILRGDSTISVFDTDRCMVDICYRYMAQTQTDFCGRCVPCREGTRRMTEMLAQLCSGPMDEEDFALLQDLGEMIHVTALCNLGKGCYSTLQSAIENFPEEFKAHLAGRCSICESGVHEPFVPGGLPYAKKLLRIDPDICRGCGKCAHNCHMGAISGKIRSPFHIDPSKCIHCYTCIENCMVGAIEEVEIDG